MKIFTDKNTAQTRFEICKKCENFNSKISQCNNCGCFMKLKVKINQATCPIGKW